MPHDFMQALSNNLDTLLQYSQHIPPPQPSLPTITPPHDLPTYDLYPPTPATPTLITSPAVTTQLQLPAQPQPSTSPATASVDDETRLDRMSLASLMVLFTRQRRVVLRSPLIASDHL
jgi:hypothetical protein